MQWLIEIYVPDNVIVIDPFMRTGTTGIASLDSGRRFVGIEIDQHYVDIARKRFQKK
jgi:site-specific DNA-methyltransferase (adenine-specific)